MSKAQEAEQAFRLALRDAVLRERLSADVAADLLGLASEWVALEKVNALAVGVNAGANGSKS